MAEQEPECHICGEVISEESSKLRLKPESCSHSMCDDCIEDLILTDPDEEQSVYPCPFCEKHTANGTTETTKDLESPQKQENNILIISSSELSEQGTENIERNEKHTISGSKETRNDQNGELKLEHRLLTIRRSPLSIYGTESLEQNRGQDAQINKHTTLCNSKTITRGAENIHSIQNDGQIVDTKEASKFCSDGCIFCNEVNTD